MDVFLPYDFFLESIYYTNSNCLPDNLLFLDNDIFGSASRLDVNINYGSITLLPFFWGGAHLAVLRAHSCLYLEITPGIISEPIEGAKDQMWVGCVQGKYPILFTISSYPLLYCYYREEIHFPVSRITTELKCSLPFQAPCCCSLCLVVFFYDAN